MCNEESFERQLFYEEGSTFCIVTCGQSPRFEVSVICDEMSWTVTAEGSSLTRSLDKVRRILETKGILLGCAGARVDVSITPLLEAEWNGRRGHLMSTHRTSTRQPLDTIDIFDPAPRDLVVTVDVQDAECRSFARGKSKWSITTGS
jgi:hypothetical protein